MIYFITNEATMIPAGTAQNKGSSPVSIDGIVIKVLEMVIITSATSVKTLNKKEESILWLGSI